MRPQGKLPESDTNVKTTLEKGGREPPNVSLESIFNNVLSFIGKSPHLKKTYKNIQKKYDFEPGSDGCWPEDCIKQAWGKTQRMDDTSLKKKRWSLAIMLQVIKKKQNLNQCIGMEAQSDQSNEKSDEEKKAEGSNKPKPQSGYIRVPISAMFKNESTCQGREGSGEKDSPTYKLIDRFPLLHEIKKKKSYTMLYNNQTRNAAWVYEILNKETRKDNVKNKDEDNKDKKEETEDTTAPHNKAATPSRDRFKFIDDTTDPLYEAIKNIEKCDETDYEQGHLASAVNHKWCQEAHKDTFVYSNMAPQVPAFNQGLWKKLEDHCQKKIDEENEIRNVHVYSGPLYLLSDKKKREQLKIWKSKVVPTHFFKVIIVEHINGKIELECYKMPNEKPKDENDQSKDKNSRSKNKNSKSKDKNSKSKDKNSQSKDNDELKNYRVPIKQIETESGLRFTESSCTEGEIDSVREVKWENAEKSCSAKIKVAISTPLTEHNDFVYI